MTNQIARTKTLIVLSEAVRLPILVTIYSTCRFETVVRVDMVHYFALS